MPASGPTSPASTSRSAAVPVRSEQGAGKRRRKGAAVPNHSSVTFLPFVIHLLFPFSFLRFAADDVGRLRDVLALIPREERDFTRVLPRRVALRIFALLDPRSLSRCARVCWAWHGLCVRDELWQPLCRRHNWLLPYVPSIYEQGAWKAHYIACVSNFRPSLHASARPRNTQRSLPAATADHEQVVDRGDADDDAASFSAELEGEQLAGTHDPERAASLARTYGRVRGLLKQPGLPRLPLDERGVPPDRRSAIQAYLQNAVATANSSAASATTPSSSPIRQTTRSLAPVSHPAATSSSGTPFDPAFGSPT